MIIYNPLDGDALTNSIPSKPRHCFLMTQLGIPIPPNINAMRYKITQLCENVGYKVIDAGHRVTGRDFLLKIWKQIASTPLSIGLCHEEMSEKTQLNIFYEFGVAQALGKETILVKSLRTEIPSDFVRSEYILFDDDFEDKFSLYLHALDEQADHYELVSDQLEKNPVLAIDYLKRAFLISGKNRLRKKAQTLLKGAELTDRAKNSLEVLAADF